MFQDTLYYKKTNNLLSDNRSNSLLYLKPLCISQRQRYEIIRITIINVNVFFIQYYKQNKKLNKNDTCNLRN